MSNVSQFTNSPHLKQRYSMETSFEQPEHLRNAYEEAYAERLARMTSRYDRQEQLTPKSPAWWMILSRIWKFGVRIISWRPSRPSSGVLYVATYAIFLLALLWLVAAFLRSNFWRRQGTRIHRAGDHDYKSTGQSVREAVVYVYYRLRYSFWLDEISRWTHKLGHFLRFDPLRIMLFGLGFMVIKVAWKAYSPAQERGVLFGERPQYFIPSHARVARHEASSADVWSLRPRKPENSFQEKEVDDDRASPSQSVLWSTTTVVMENTNLPTTKTETQILTEISVITVTQSCQPTPDILSDVQAPGHGCDSTLPPFVETCTITVTERHTESSTKAEQVAASHVPADEPRSTIEKPMPSPHSTEKSTRRAIDGDLVWCNSCRQKHCCELP